MKKPNNNSQQKLTIVWPVPSERPAHYHVCYTEVGEWLRITSIAEVYGVKDAYRIIRQETPELWDALRKAVVNGEHVIYTKPRNPRRRRKEVAAK